MIYHMLKHYTVLYMFHDMIMKDFCSPESYNYICLICLHDWTFHPLLIQYHVHSCVYGIKNSGYLVPLVTADL